jgi:hypothetical protein
MCTEGRVRTQDAPGRASGFREADSLGAYPPPRALSVFKLESCSAQLHADSARCTLKEPKGFKLSAPSSHPKQTPSLESGRSRAGAGPADVCGAHTRLPRRVATERVCLCVHACGGGQMVRECSVRACVAQHRGPGDTVKYLAFLSDAGSGAGLSGAGDAPIYAPSISHVS